jgi:hypothetical protein
VLLTLAASPAVATAAPRVTTFPGAGWRAASPGTGITVRGVAAAALGRLRVRGSRSGLHRGRLRPLRLGRGAVFTPARRFLPGERVTVRGVPGLPRFAFTIARPAVDGMPGGGDDAPPGGTTDLRRAAAGAGGVGTCTPRRRRFRTHRHWRPVGICVIRPASWPSAHGRILVTPKTAPHRQQALMMLRNDGRLLWYRVRRGYVRDLKTVRLRGRGLLAFYQFRARRRSHYVLMDRHYRVVRRVFPGNGLRMNMHELQITRRETAYFGAYQAVRVRGVRGLVTDFVLQELDLRTGQVLFEWHALDHVPLSASYEPRPRDGASWDYFHGNSIDAPGRRGRTIVASARNTSAVYGIDRRTGRVRWTFGGRRDEFGLLRDHPAWQFCGQHDVRRLGGRRLQLFDDGGRGLNPGACPLHPARVMRFRLPRRRHAVALLSTIPSGVLSPGGAGFFPGGLGSAQPQRHGGVFVSWGTAGVLSDVRPGGRVGFALRLGRYSYRAVRAPWIGRPRDRPRIAVRRRPGGVVDVWASWNGATNVRWWRVVAGPSRHRLRPVGRRVRFAGLETHLRVRTRRRHIAVRALGAKNRVLARSRVVRSRRPARR